MMAAFTASRHFMATLGAPRPRRSERNGNCSPTRAAVALWLCPPIRCSRTAHEPSTLMRGCAPTRMSEAAASSLTAAHMITNSWANDANSSNKLQKPEPRQERQTRLTRNHLILPVLMCENRSRTTCSRFHRLRVMVTFAVYPRLFSHHFDNQCSICLSPPKPKFNERFARPSTMVSLKCIFLSS